MSATAVLGLAAPAASAAPDRVADGVIAADPSAACLGQLLFGGVCTLPVNPAGAGTPYVLDVPAGLKSATVVVAGGAGANSDGGTGGRGGLVVASVQFRTDTISVWVAQGGSSWHGGHGWYDGGDGQEKTLLADSGGGGGSSALITPFSGFPDGYLPSIIAGGGGGAGGGGVVNDFATSGKGGNGGDAGIVAQPGQDGQLEPGFKDTVAGTGGCANAPTDPCDDDAHGSTTELYGGGDALETRSNLEPGGGGGAGYYYGGYAGSGGEWNPVDPYAFPGGGGGGGGQSTVYTDLGPDPVSRVTLLASGTSNTHDGSVTFYPGSSASTAFPCTGPASAGTYTVPSNVYAVQSVVVGGGGGATSHPDETGLPGRGAIVVGTLAVTPGEVLSVTPGCRGYGRNASPGAGPGGGGGAAPAFDADDGGGGGGGSAVTDAAGDQLLVAGGGGGSGGVSRNFFAIPRSPNENRGGDAGLNWGPDGAGDGTGVSNTHELSCPTATCGGGQGAASAQTNGGGDTGTAGIDTPGGGGGGGGGGGFVGGQGGAGTLMAILAGGGGGAGSSIFDTDRVSDPVVGSSEAEDGTVVLIPLPGVAPFDNNGIGPTTFDGDPGPGLDGTGNRYDPQALAQQGIRPGGGVPVGDVVVPWPDVPVGAGDNHLAHGQSLTLTGSGSTLVVVGSATFGPASGTATVTYSDGTTSTFVLAFADWTDGDHPAAGSTTVARMTPTGGLSGAALYAQAVPLDPAKQAVTLTLPDVGATVGQGVTALHVFGVAVGGRDNQGVSATAGSATGGPGYFDGNGGAFTPAGLASVGLLPGTRLGALGAVVTWPEYAPGAADNYVAQGQRVGISGDGDRLVVVGASTYASGSGVTGAASVTYTDGTSTGFDLGFADWTSTSPLAGTITVAESSSDQGDGVRVFATSIPLDPTRTVAWVTLPNGPPATAGAAALHVFSLAVGSGTRNDGIGPGTGTDLGGFDGLGNQYSLTGLTAAGLSPGGTIPVSDVFATWPDVPAAAPDNDVAAGQTLPLTGIGSTLVVLGASSFGVGSGTATVVFSSNTTSDITLTLPDWEDVSGALPAGVTRVATDTTTGHAVFAQTFTLPAGVQAVGLRLPVVSDGGQATAGTTALHVFSTTLGGPDNQGLTVDDTARYFDGQGNGYYPATDFGLPAAGPVQVDGATLTWPAYAEGVADNYTAQGQTVPLSGQGDRLVVLGAATWGPAVGSGTVTYTDGSTATVSLGFADWLSATALPGTAIYASTIQTSDDTRTVRVFSARVPLDPSKSVASLTLPQLGSTDQQGSPVLHLFAFAVGGVAGGGEPLPGPGPLPPDPTPTAPTPTAPTPTAPTPTPTPTTSPTTTPTAPTPPPGTTSVTASPASTAATTTAPNTRVVAAPHSGAGPIGSADGGLAWTGVPVATLLALALLMVTAGAAALAGTRRTRRASRRRP